ncbi:MAG: N-6 DNA methylase [Ktedonobacteraceae bacterium]
MPLAEVLDTLDYSQSPYYLKTKHTHEPEVASLFRAAHNAGVDGIYVFHSKSEKNTFSSVRPAVFMAEAKTPEDARAIHRSLWNLSQAPFLIVVLPDHIRVYTGFDYSRTNESVGNIEPLIALDKNSILEQLADFCAEAINTGQLWRNRSQHLKPNKRVDQRLLKNLSQLGKFLREKMGLSPQIAHALIGKYVYIRYLRDQNILSDQWLEQHTIDIDSILGRNATVNGLRRLCTILDVRFNGSIFPLDFNSDQAPGDEHVRQVAAIFKGDEQLPGEGGLQLSLDNLDFRVYDFAYIPVGLLSSIYEQFLHIEGKGRKVGAYYTPEYLADYLISEMNTVMPLREDMKILDPTCGSGIFLVLIYAHLIETRLAHSDTDTGTLPLLELLELLEHLYGIEREPDACYVAEFSLILTLLHYANVSEFLLNEHFKLPSLHNTHIFQYDFFDDSSPVWAQDMIFDWIIGNPPWIKADNKEEPLAAAWIDMHKKEQPIDGDSVAEALSWRILRLLAPTGYVGLILPAALLYSLHARPYRQSFFEECEVQRMTNFSNLRDELFEGRATAPAITIIYRQNVTEQEKPPIEHYGPFAINQITKSHDRLWTITINEHEYQTVSPYEAARGDSATWKFALWGTQRDKRTIARLRKFFPQTLGQLCNPPWHLHEGSQLRNGITEHTEELEHFPYLEGKKRLDTNALNESGFLFSISDHTLEVIPAEECFIRKQGGFKGLLVSDPPHLIINASWNYVIYSDEYFLVKPRQIGLSAPEEDAGYLRALSVFLSSNLVRYYLFFQSPQWGIERDRITLDTVKSIPIPVFTPEQVAQLAALQKELVSMEHEQGSAHAQAYLDEQTIRILQVPDSITMIVTEFMQFRLKMVGGGTREAIQKAQQRPDQEALQGYALQLTNALDGFLDSSKTHHRVTIEPSSDLICCRVEFIKSDRTFSPVIEKTSSQNGQVFSKLQRALKKEFSQWVYVQRGLRMFGHSSVSLYKLPQLINWTRTQAMNDADDMIAEILFMAGQHR